MVITYTCDVALLFRIYTYSPTHCLSLTHTHTLIYSPRDSLLSRVERMKYPSDILWAVVAREDETATSVMHASMAGSAVGITTGSAGSGTDTEQVSYPDNNSNSSSSNSASNHGFIKGKGVGVAITDKAGSVSALPLLLPTLSQSLAAGIISHQTSVQSAIGHSVVFGFGSGLDLGDLFLLTDFAIFE